MPAGGSCSEGWPLPWLHQPAWQDASGWGRRRRRRWCWHWFPCFMDIIPGQPRAAPRHSTFSLSHNPTQQSGLSCEPVIRQVEFRTPKHCEMMKLAQRDQGNGRCIPCLDWLAREMVKLVEYADTIGSTKSLDATKSSRRTIQSNVVFVWLSRHFKWNKPNIHLRHSRSCKHCNF